MKYTSSFPGAQHFWSKEDNAEETVDIGTLLDLYQVDCPDAAADQHMSSSGS
jgi:hypothetical protein